MQGEAARGQICPCCSKRYKSALSLKHHLTYSGPRRTFMWEHRNELQHEASAEQHPQMPWRSAAQDPVQASAVFDRDIDLLTRELEYTLQHDFGEIGQVLRQSTKDSQVGQTDCCNPGICPY